MAWFDRAKLARGVMLAAVALLLGVALVGCGNESSAPSEEERAQQEARRREALEEAVCEQLDRLKAPTIEQVNQLLVESGVQVSEIPITQGVDVAEAMSHMLSKFDYVVGDMTLQDKNASVKVTVRNVDMNEVARQAEQQMASDEMVSAMLGAYESEDAEAFAKQSMAIAYACIDASTHLVSCNVVLELEETADGRWDISPKSLETLVTEAYGGLSADAA